MAHPNEFLNEPAIFIKMIWFWIWVLRFRTWVLRFRVLGASFSSFGCFVLRSSFSSASFSKLPSKIEGNERGYSIFLII